MQLLAKLLIFAAMGLGNIVKFIFLEGELLMLTLEECRKRPITDLYMAEFIIYLTLEESYERIHKQFSEKEASKKISAVDLIFNEAFDELIKKGIVSETEKEKEISYIKKNERFIKSRFATIVLKVSENQYQNLSEDYIDLSRCKLVHTEPFSDYYNESDYSFLLRDGRVAIDVSSTKPFEYFEWKNL